MPRGRVATRERRHAKRAAAQASRPTKYANQKGGGIQKARRHHGSGKRDRASDVTAESSEEPMVVIRDGKAVWAGGDEPAGQDPAPVPESDVADDRFTSAEKKLRALKKKFRRVLELKQRRRGGEELDGAQLKILRTEASLRAEIDRFEADANVDDTADAEVDNMASGHDADDNLLEDSGGAVGEVELSGSRLQQRRERKRLRHIEKLKARKTS